MIVGILLGRKGSVGFPGKNTYPVHGRPLMEYPILAAKESSVIDRIFVSTDDPKIVEIAKQHGCDIIDRPPELCSPQALGEDAYVHAYRVAQERTGNRITLCALLFCNAATLLPDHIREGVSLLQKDPSYDSAVTVSRYNMWSPLRARKVSKDHSLVPFVPFETFGDPKTLNCDRDSQGDVLFADMSLSIVRPACLENIHSGLLPQKWMGQKIYPIRNDFGCDVDYEWQIPTVEYWIKKNRPELVR